MSQSRRRLGYEQSEETSTWLKARLGPEPIELAMILGSGLGTLADGFEGIERIDYAEIPNFPLSTVEGHAGRLVVGRYQGKRAVAMQGRFHFYEGWSLEEVTFPVRVFKLLGCAHLVVTNSSGGINVDWTPGDLMLITDHINLTGANPLVGHNDERFGPRFPDMSDAYSLELRRHAIRTSRRIGLKLRTGVYAGVLGPSYETPHEIKMMRRMGADAVGMSTVPEVIVANHMGIKVLGISCITNMAAGVSAHPLTHDEVTENAARARARFGTLLDEIVGTLGDVAGR